MELRINLNDREEIAAAVPLLQTILDATPKTCGGQCSHGSPEHVVDFSATQAAGLVDLMAGKSAADVFAGTGLPLPPGGALSSAGAAPLPIAPEVPTATTSAATPAPVPPAPTTASAAAAPSAPAAPSTPAPAVELDSKGLPWDARIHAGSKAKVKDGSWRAKKEIDPALVVSVEAELRAQMAATAAPAGWPFAGDAAAPGVPANPAAPFVPPAATLPPAAPVVPSVAADPTTFEQLMPRITAAVTGGILPPTAIGAACAAVGLPSVVSLQTSPQHVPHVWASLKQQYPSLV